MSDAQDTGTATNDAGNVQNDAGAGTPAVDGKLADGGNTDTGSTANKTGDAGNTADKGGEADKSIEYVIEVPEGFELDEAAATQFKEIAGKHKLSAEGAKELVDLVVKREQARAEAHAATVKGWAEAVNSDKEMGTPEAKAAAAKVIDTYGTPELKAMLEHTGFGNHPEVVRLAFNLSKVLSEDSFVSGRQGAGSQPRSPEEILYGKSN